MLSEIHVTDLGVIEEAHLDLSPGLTVVSGETGAGKTMVVTALGLLLGQRADSALVRNGASRAVVEGVALLPPEHPARRRAAEAGAEPAAEDTADDLILVRSVSAEGRSRAHVGGRTAPIGVLADIGESLVAVHGQADQWRLRQLDQHRELLDRFGGEELLAAVSSHQEAYAAHAAAAAELTDLRAKARERAQEAAGLTVGLERIEAIDPRAGEDRDLAAEAERLTHVEELRAAAAEASELLSGADDMSGQDDGGVLAALARIRSVIDHAMSNDPELAALGRRAAELGHLATDLAGELSSYLADLEVEPGRLDLVQARRAALADLTKVYGSDIDEVLDWSRRAASRLGGLLGDDDRIADLEAGLSALESRRTVTAGTVTTLRTAAGERLAAAVMDELTLLAMPSAIVGVEVRPAQRMGVHGADEIEIGLSANVGGPLRPIARSASGGELSRIMLAIEVATAAASDGPPTFVFDEVDAGIGGRAALAVGARLAALATSAQVIVVTHLAQVAAHADRHLVVRKAHDGQVTRSGVTAVEGADRLGELARMLGGTDSAAALAHAKDLLAQVNGGTLPA